MASSDHRRGEVGAQCRPAAVVGGRARLFAAQTGWSATTTAPACQARPIVPLSVVMFSGRLGGRVKLIVAVYQGP